MARTYQNGKTITHDGPCPMCRSHGRDRTGNHLQFWVNNEGEQWAHCNRCGHYVPDEDDKLSKLEKKERKVLTDEEVQEILKEIEELPIQPLTSRSVQLSTAERFGIRVALSTTDGSTQVSHYYPKTKNGEITGYKVRVLNPKFFFAQGRGSGCDFFGLEQAKAKDVIAHTLYIFEDELSTCSGYEALRQFTPEKWKNCAPACVGLPDGAQSAGQVCNTNREFLEGFKEIVVCMDNDEAGEAAVKVFQQLYPGKVKVARLPLKDANDMAMAGRMKELYNALRFSAKVETPDGAVNLMDCIGEALKKPEWGLSYPWPGLTKLTYGIRPEIIAIGGGVGLGKTLIGHELVAHLVNVERQRIGCFFLEESIGKSAQNIAGKVASVPFHRPDVEYDPELLKSILEGFGDNVALWENKGQNSWENIKACIRFWAVTEGRKIFIMDNITALTSHLTPSEINTEISKIAGEMAGMCDELGVTIFVFSHLNTPNGGKTHEEGGEVKEAQFTGSRALMRWCQVILGFERNKYAEGDEKNVSRIKLLKDRNYGGAGYIHTRYAVETGRLTEISEEDLEAIQKAAKEAQKDIDDDVPF